LTVTSFDGIALWYKWLCKGKYKGSERKAAAQQYEQVLEFIAIGSFLFYLGEEFHIGKINLLKPSEIKKMNNDRYG